MMIIPPVRTPPLMLDSQVFIVASEKFALALSSSMHYYWSWSTSWGCPQMMKHQPFSSLPISLIIAIAYQPGAAESLGPVSEETPPAFCDPGAFISSIRCTGRYCDNVQITCTRFRDAMLGQGSWMPWVSEEQGRRECPPNHLIAGFACRGSYCDNISLYCVQVTNMSAVNCRDSRFVSEENGGSLSFFEGGDGGGQMLFARSMRCSGRYCDNKSFNICEINRR
jgi:hypothetical protein